MTLTVIIGFVTCLTPYFIVNLVRIYSNYTIGMKKALHVSEAIFMTHSALNPILYGIFSLRIEHLYKVLNTCLCLVPVRNAMERDTSVDSLGQMNNLDMLRLRFARLGREKSPTTPIAHNGQSFARKSFLRKNVGRAFKVTFKQNSNTFHSTLQSQNLRTDTRLCNV